MDIFDAGITGNRRAALIALASAPLIYGSVSKQSTRRVEVTDVTTGVVLDLPYEYRTKNWGGGSCVHATTVNLLKWMGQDELAIWWRNNYSGGEYDDRLIKRMEAANLKYAYIHAREKGAAAGRNFLEWCSRTRRGAGIFYKPNHAINYIGQDATYVYLLDNNATKIYEPVPVSTFYSNWMGFGGFAWTLVYNPPPHEPLK